jgi:glycyl-tRNA synthetase beta chain
MKKDSFLVEIGTEELPAKNARLLSVMFSNLIQQQLKKENFELGTVEVFSTPRRMAVLIHQASDTQPDKHIEKKGPTVEIAFDSDKNPTLAGLGFARSCGVSFDELEIQQNEEHAYLLYKTIEKGKSLFEIIPSIITSSLNALNAGKTMRWNSFDSEFLRPIHWIVLMYGNQLIPAETLHLRTTQYTQGHRFHCPEKLYLSDAGEYETVLEKKGSVIPSFEKRRKKIQQQIKKICSIHSISSCFDPQAQSRSFVPKEVHEHRDKLATKSQLERRRVIDAKIHPNEALLDEVTGLVERPEAYLATFAEDFLTLPKEVLICAIEQHQKCFPMENLQGAVLPNFIAISNIKSRNPSQVIVGNERVMRARLSDAAFFYHTDKKRTLESRVADLAHITFQKNLGSLLDKTQRISALAEWISQQWLLDETAIADTRRAGLLAKADLSSDMVGEFPELQGIMGYYYALHDQESSAVIEAIREHYLPRFSGDAIPRSTVSCALAIADRIDNLVGIFSLGQMPSGDKDPFGLKRAAMAISRILIEQGLSISLSHLIERSIGYYQALVKNKDITPALSVFILERLRAWYGEKGLSPDIFNAVIAIQNNEPLDIHRRVMAVEHFKQLPEAKALTAANKRVSNILDQAAIYPIISAPNPQLFETDAEKNLYSQIKQLEVENDQQNYTHRLTELASLQPSVDQFFDNVMVMVSNEHQRNNRLQLLAQLRALFLQIADISVLQL